VPNTAGYHVYTRAPGSVAIEHESPSSTRAYTLRPAIEQKVQQAPRTHDPQPCTPDRVPPPRGPTCVTNNTTIEESSLRRAVHGRPVWWLSTRACTSGVTRLEHPERKRGERRLEYRRERSVRACPPALLSATIHCERGIKTQPAAIALTISYSAKVTQERRHRAARASIVPALRFLIGSGLLSSSSHQSGHCHRFRRPADPLIGGHTSQSGKNRCRQRVRTLFQCRHRLRATKAPLREASSIWLH